MREALSPLFQPSGESNICTNVRHPLAGRKSFGVATKFERKPMESDDRICPEKEEEIWAVIDELQGAEKGRAYYELANFAFAREQYHRSLALAEMARDLFVELEQCYEGLAYSQSSISFSCAALSDRTRAIEEMTKAVDYFEKYSIQGESDKRRTLISWLYEEDRHEEAFSYIEKNIEHALYEEQTLQCGIEYTKLADGLCRLNREEQAIEKYLLARDKFVESKEVERVADTDFYIGRCYNHLKNAIEAERFLERALSVYESAELEDDLAKTRAQLGRAKLLVNDCNEALGHFESARKIVLRQEDINFYALYRIQANMIRAMRGIGWDAEADLIEKRNCVINEVLQIDNVDA